MTVELRPLCLADEEDYTLATAELEREGHHFGMLYGADLPWPDFVRQLREEEAGRVGSATRVPSTFRVAVVDGQLVGRTSIRHELNDFLLRIGGHIGYAVRPQHCRRGYATEILRQSLAIAKGLGITSALLTCDEDNVGSQLVIERCGGALEDRAVDDVGIVKRRYWCPT